MGSREEILKAAERLYKAAEEAKRVNELLIKMLEEMK